MYQMIKKRKQTTCSDDLKSKRKKPSNQCQHAGCVTRSTFNHEGQKTALYCKSHALIGMVDIKHPRCQHTEERSDGIVRCTTRPNFNHEGQKTALYCKSHALTGMVDIKSRRCQHTEERSDGIVRCTTRSTFNHEGQKTALYCKSHALTGMVDIKSRRCQHTEERSDGIVRCTTQPSFNHEGQKTALYCKTHALTGMVDILNRRCQQAGCTTHPSFNHEGQKTALYCKSHALTGMVNIVSPRCQQAGCTTLPTFNHEGQKTALYCKNHALTGMVNIVSPRCQHTEERSDGIVRCTKGPCFNHEGQKTALYCKSHALTGMVNIVSPRCQHTEERSDGIVRCTTGPSFNHEGQKTALYCKTHALTGMVDIKNPRCQHTEERIDGIVRCTKGSWNGIPGHRPTHCAEHRTDGMITHPLRRCEENKCPSFALYGMNSTPTHCESHKAPQHMNLVQHTCVICEVLDYVDDERKCGRCSEYLTKKLHLRKQRQVKLWMDAHLNLKNYTSYDRQWDGGSCGKERPDFVWDCKTHYVILEVDEFQHRERPCECEQTRMVNVVQGMGMPCLWVRYNPDEFKGQKASLKERDRRELLEKWLMECQISIPTSSQDYCRVTYLFFDGFQVNQPMSIEKIPIL